MKINIIDEFGKKKCHGTKRMQVSSQPIRFRNLGDMFLLHCFKKTTTVFQKFKFCKPYAAFAQNSSHCWNDLLNTKFEEPTSNTDISGKTKNDKT